MIGVLDWSDRILKGKGRGLAWALIGCGWRYTRYMYKGDEIFDFWFGVVVPFFSPFPIYLLVVDAAGFRFPCFCFVYLKLRIAHGLCM